MKGTPSRESDVAFAALAAAAAAGGMGIGRILGIRRELRCRAAAGFPGHRAAAAAAPPDGIIWGGGKGSAYIEKSSSSKLFE